MVIGKVLTPALLLLPEARNGCVDEGLDRVVQSQLIAEPGALQLDAALGAARPAALDSLQQTRLAN